MSQVISFAGHVRRLVFRLMSAVVGLWLLRFLLERLVDILERFG